MEFTQLRGLPESLSPTERFPLRLLADYWVNEHSKLCHPDEPIVLGPLEDIDVEDRGKYQYWVDNGQVFLHIKCPGRVHESTSATLAYLIMKSLDKAGIGLTYINPGGSVTCAVENQLGCHARFCKEPDSSIQIATEIQSNQMFPVIACETAAHHENLHHLLCEAAAWLNSRTDTVYCVVIKLYPSKGLCVIYQFERSAEICSELIDLPKSPKKEEVMDKVSAEQAVPLASKKSKRHCSTFNPEDLTSTKRLENRYKLKVIREYRIGLEDAVEAELVFELKKLFCRTSIPVSLYDDRLLVININAVVTVARREMNKYNEEGRLKDTGKEMVEEEEEVSGD